MPKVFEKGNKKVDKMKAGNNWNAYLFLMQRFTAPN